MRFARLLLALGLSLAQPATAENRAMIVLDGSGSMWGQIEGKTKIEIARATLAEVLGTLPADRELGLMVYGHRTKGDCNDIELAVPAAAGTAGAIEDFANGINPKGKTPLSAAVRQAAEALKFTEDKATVILVTDGLETCDADPCALGRELEAAGVDFTAHVVGFGLSSEEGAQVACLADETGGRYVQADNAEALSDALKETVAVEADPEPEPAPQPESMPEPAAAPEFNFHGTASLAEGGPDLDEAELYWALHEPRPDGKPGRRVSGGYRAVYDASVPAGAYILVTQIGNLRLDRPVKLTEDKTTEVHVVLGAGVVALSGRRTEGGEIEREMRLDLRNDKYHDGAYGEGVFYVPEGKVTLTARIGKAVHDEEFALKAGERVQKDIVLGVGVVVATALYAEGGPEVETGGIRYTVLEAKTDLQGRRAEIVGTYGSDPMNVPSGEYVLKARLEAAEVFSEPFEVKAGQRSEVQVVLNAGVAALTAPGGYRIEILGKKNLQGERKTIAGAYGEEMSITLPAGTYLGQVRYQGDKAAVEAEFTVTAGERIEVELK